MITFVEITMYEWGCWTPSLNPFVSKYNDGVIQIRKQDIFRFYQQNPNINNDFFNNVTTATRNVINDNGQFEV